jgi:hypothetical protein
MPILQRVACPDDPRLMLEQRLCVSALSKDLRGEIGDHEAERRECDDPRCVTITTRQSLRLVVTPSQPPSGGCDRDPAKLEGILEVQDLVHVFDFDGETVQRGFHSGDFRWQSPPPPPPAPPLTLVLGRLSGITNAGTHREPVLRRCQGCEARGFLQGRLCGTIVRAEDPQLRGCQVFANYLLRVPELGSDGIPAQGGLLGTLEGVLVCGCGCCG